jgi:hypothetical protein
VEGFFYPALSSLYHNGINLARGSHLPCNVDLVRKIHFTDIFFFTKAIVYKKCDVPIVKWQVKRTFIINIDRKDIIIQNTQSIFVKTISLFYLINNNYLNNNNLYYITLHNIIVYYDTGLIRSILSHARV